MCENFTGADLKALLYNAQLEVIHRNTSSSQLYGQVFTERETSNQTGEETVGHDEAEWSLQASPSKDVIYIPSLRKGQKKLSLDEATKLKAEVRLFMSYPEITIPPFFLFLPAPPLCMKNGAKDMLWTDANGGNRNKQIIKQIHLPVVLLVACSYWNQPGSRSWSWRTARGKGTGTEPLYPTPPYLSSRNLYQSMSISISS